MTSPSKPIGILVLLWLVGWTLRVPMLATPALATHIADSFGLGPAGIGALTMLPVLAVAFGAIPAAWIIGRIGLRYSITAGLVIMALASLARGQVPGAEMLFLMSIIMGFGVAIFQTALPAATRIWTPKHIALGSAVYLNGMMLGELSGAGFTLPAVLPIAGGDWRIALLLWSLPIVLIAAAVMIARLPKAQDRSTLAPQSALPRWNDGRVWQYGLLLAHTTVAFYVINAYIATLLTTRGEAEHLPAVIFAYNCTPLMGSFVILVFPQWMGKRMPIGISAVIACIGVLGFFMFTGPLSWGFAMLTGFVATIQLILLMSLPPMIATGQAVTRLSAGMTLVGLTIACALPMIGGYIAAATGQTGHALLPSLIFMVVSLAALGRAAKYPPYH